MALLIKVKDHPHGSNVALAGFKGLCHQKVQPLTSALYQARVHLPVPPGIISAARYAKSLALCGNAEFACIVIHERVLHFRLFAK